MLNPPGRSTGARTRNAVARAARVLGYDHVTITGTSTYHMEFLDAGGSCEYQTSDRYDGPGVFNFKVDVSFRGFPLAVT